jgi:hypothetical protein
MFCHSERSEESKKRREKDSRFHGNDKTNRQSPVIASPDKSGLAMTMRERITKKISNCSFWQLKI